MNGPISVRVFLRLWERARSRKAFIKQERRDVFLQTFLKLKRVGINADKSREIIRRLLKSIGKIDFRRTNCYEHTWLGLGFSCPGGFVAVSSG